MAGPGDEAEQAIAKTVVGTSDLEANWVANGLGDHEEGKVGISNAYVSEVTVVQNASQAGTMPEGFWAKRISILWTSKPLKLRAIIGGGLVLSFLMLITSLAVFLAEYVNAFYLRGVLYSYSSPLSAMWTGIGGMWFSAMLILWWVALCPTFTRAGHYFWAGSGLVLAFEGFLTLVAHAASKNESAAAAGAILWLGLGSAAFFMSFSWLRHPIAADAMRPPVWWCSPRQCCCSPREWAVGFGVFIQLWMFLFLTGFTAQAIASAADYGLFPPPGKVLEISGTRGALNPELKLKMHIWCQGPTDSGMPTIVMEHGGGSNCLALKGVADALTTKHGRRTCVYDRLGYGWSPSLYVRSSATDLPTSGELLLRLLAAAEESGPYQCVGHSAGGKACLSFATAAASESVAVTGLAVLDGYPDLITAGAFRPGKKNKFDGESPALSGTRLFAVLAGPTALTRGLVGDPGEHYVPHELRGTMIALYAQTRFWLAQYTDLAVEDVPAWKALQGSEGEEGLITYGKTLDAKVLILPAFKTVDKTCEEGSKAFCCGPRANDYSICANEKEDSKMYLEQSKLYASTLGQTPGVLAIAPKGTDHGYPWHKDYYMWAVDQIVQHL